MAPDVVPADYIPESTATVDNFVGNRGANALKPRQFKLCHRLLKL
jgi:hypothetical protein